MGRLNIDCLTFSDIARSGHHLGSEALEPTHTATTVRVRNGKVQTVDGPFAETREQLAGFYFLEAKDLNEALAIAARIPPARLAASKCARCARSSPKATVVEAQPPLKRNSR